MVTDIIDNADTRGCRVILCLRAASDPVNAGKGFQNHENPETTRHIALTSAQIVITITIAL